MFVAVSTRTMANARFKEPGPKPVIVDWIAERRRRAVAAAQRERDAAEVRRVAEQAIRDRARATIEAGNRAIAARRAGQAEAAVKAAASAVTVSAVIRRICRATGYSADDILGPRRKVEIVLIRHAAMYWSRRLTGLSLPQLGRAFGMRDHTTILHGVRAYVAKRDAMGRKLREVR